MIVYFLQLAELQSVPEKKQNELQQLEERKNDLEVSNYYQVEICCTDLLFLSFVMSYHKIIIGCKCI